LVFSLKIGERFEKLKGYSEKLAGAADWAVYPTTAWNYGLVLDSVNAEGSAKVTVRKPTAAPFANEGAPVVVNVKGRLVKGWGMVNNSADAPPASPVESAEPLVDLQLIPYGCTRLRVTEFPVVKP
jgi:hypothetical protein